MTGFINRTVEHRGYKLNCRDPYGFWDIDGDTGQVYTTVGKAKDAVDLLLKEKEKQAAASKKIKTAA